MWISNCVMVWSHSKKFRFCSFIVVEWVGVDVRYMCVMCYMFGLVMCVGSRRVLLDSYIWFREKISFIYRLWLGDGPNLMGDSCVGKCMLCWYVRWSVCWRWVVCPSIVGDDGAGTWIVSLSWTWASTAWSTPKVCDRAALQTFAHRGCGATCQLGNYWFWNRKLISFLDPLQASSEDVHTYTCSFCRQRCNVTSPHRVNEVPGG